MLPNVGRFSFFALPSFVKETHRILFRSESSESKSLPKQVSPQLTRVCSQVQMFRIISPASAETRIEKAAETRTAPRAAYARCAVVDREAANGWDQPDELPPITRKWNPELSELDAPSEGLMQRSAVCCAMFGPPQTVPLIVFMAIEIQCHIVERPRAFFVPLRTRALLPAARSWPAPAR